MGFSVSGSYAIIAIGTFMAIGMFYGAASNGAERVTESQSAVFDDNLEQQNTAINLTNASYNATPQPEILTINVTNSGSTALEVNDTDYIVDNELVTHAEIVADGNSVESVDGDSATDLWLPGERLHIEISSDIAGVSNPDRVRIVSGPGVADSMEVTVI